jgi:hypothetical protein
MVMLLLLLLLLLRRSSLSAAHQTEPARLAEISFGDDDDSCRVSPRSRLDPVIHGGVGVSTWGRQSMLAWGADNRIPPSR